MKNRLINLIKISILLFGIPFLLTNCNQDELDSIKEEQGIIAKYKKKTITSTELQTKLNKYSSFGELQAKAGGGFVTSLELNNVIEFSSEEKNTYTIKANTINERSFTTTNLIIEEKNQELTYYLLRYLPSLKYVKSKTENSNPIILFDGIIQFLDYEGNILEQNIIVDGQSRTTSGCITNVQYIYDNCGAGGNADGHGPVEGTPSCEATNGSPLIGITYDIIDCPESGNSGLGGEDSGNTGDGNPLGDGNTNTGGGTNNNDNDTGNNNDNTSNEDIPQIPTDPIFGDTSENDIGSMFNEFLDSNNQITQSQINWIYLNAEHTIIGQQVYNLLYLGANSGQDYSNIDLDGIFNFLLQNGGEIEFSTISENGMLEFNTFEDFENYLNQNNPNLEETELIPNNQNGTTVTRFKAKFNNSVFPLYMNLRITSTLDDPTTNDNEFNLEEVNTFLTGFTALIEWSQDSIEDSSVDHVTNVTSEGHFIYGLRVGGNIFTWESEGWLINAFFNNQTGQAITWNADTIN